MKQISFPLSTFNEPGGHHVQAITLIPTHASSGSKSLASTVAAVVGKLREQAFTTTLVAAGKLEISTFAFSEPTTLRKSMAKTSTLFVA